MKAENRRTCSVCGSEFYGGLKFCPVCMLRMGLALGGERSDSSTPGDSIKPTPKDIAHQFDHYELVQGEDGKPVELGRGAMGVTFKASDTVLGNDVALKVIDARIAAHAEARERFLREARAAARFRHPNVASVFYYGTRKSDGQCFYAMELVEGETLEAHLRRSGPMLPAVALEVIAQVASALGAAEEHKLVHRDLKPANLMLVKGPELTVKVIDFGLAKAATTAASEADLTHGGFVGTPAFASPEQFTSANVDVRSDLYSLGITLWAMLIGKPPFSGSPAEVMYQHQRVPLPLEQLEKVPPQVVVLIKLLLAKDPARRPQNPSGLRMMLGEVKAALDTQRQVDFIRDGRAAEFGVSKLLHPNWMGGNSDSIQAVLHGGSCERSPQAPLELLDFTPFLRTKFKGFTGRQWLFQEIDEWCEKGSQLVLLIVGEPGVGKSSIVSALVHENHEGKVLAYHCCRADTPTTLEPAGFVRSIAAMFATRLDGYAEILEEPAIVNALKHADTDPASAFEAAVLTPLHKFLQPGRAPQYLLIDALDEALTRTKRPTIVDVLSTRLNFLPPLLRIVATTRSEARILSQLRSLRAHTLSAQDPRNQDDVRHFVQCRLAQPVLLGRAQASGRTFRALEEDLLKASAGNFLFVTTALDLK
jgi:serine/threonine protein kinase